MVQSKVLRNNKICKDKLNGLNFNYKKLLNYHQGIGHLTSFQELFTQECDQHHLPGAFSRKAYETIKLFQGECIINAHVNVWDLQAKGHGNYVPQVQEGACKKTKTLQILYILSYKNFLAITLYHILNNIHQNNNAMHNNHGQIHEP